MADVMMPGEIIKELKQQAAERLWPHARQPIVSTL